MPAPIRLQVRLSAEPKETIASAAAVLGVSVSEFVSSTVAQRVLTDSRVTRLSNPDRDIFLEMLDDVDRKPNAALVAAVSCYRALRQ